MRLSGKVAVMAGSGAQNEPGYGLALRAGRGTGLPAGAQPRTASEATVALAAQRGGVARYVQADLTSDEQTRAAFGRIIDEAGGVDIVCHHVGGHMSWEHDVTQLEPDFWERVYASIMRTLFLTTRYAVPAMEARGGGALLTIAASYRVRLDANSAYASARDAQVGFVRNLARPLAPKNIRVHAICSGYMRPEHLKTRGSGPSRRGRGSSTAWAGPRTSPTPRCTWPRTKRRGSPARRSASTAATTSWPAPRRERISWNAGDRRTLLSPVPVTAAPSTDAATASIRWLAPPRAGPCRLPSVCILLTASVSATLQQA